MPNFDYIVRNEKGARKTGSITAENYNKAIENLQNQNLTIIKLKEADTSFDFIRPFEFPVIYLEEKGSKRSK